MVLDANQSENSGLGSRAVAKATRRDSAIKITSADTPIMDPGPPEPQPVVLGCHRIPDERGVQIKMVLLFKLAEVFVG